VTAIHELYSFLCEYFVLDPIWRLCLTPEVFSATEAILAFNKLLHYSLSRCLTNGHSPKPYT